MTDLSGHHTLAAEDLTLAYDEVEVATDLSISIPTGRVTCIVGANACGKSTLLRALARLLKPRAGTVLLDGGVHPAPAHEGGGDEAGHPPAVADRPRGHHGGRPRRPRSVPAPEVVPAVDGG